MSALKGTIIKRIVGETGRPIVGTLGSLDGTLPSSLPEGSTIFFRGTNVATDVVTLAERDVTSAVTDWATLAFSVPLLVADVAAAGSYRLRFRAIPLGSSDPTGDVFIPEDDARFGLYLVVTPI